MKRSALALSFFLAGCQSCTDAGTAPPAPDAHAKVTDAAPPIEASLEASAPIDDLPDGGAADLGARGKHLLEAITQDDAQLAADIVLPREAYLTARDAPDPGASYDNHFKSSFESQIRRAHRHEKGSERAIFVTFDLGANPSRIVPKKKEWKEALWHVTRSTLTFTIDGRVHRLEIAEMIAWKGAWYVAKLH